MLCLFLRQRDKEGGREREHTHTEKRDRYRETEREMFLICRLGGWISQVRAITLIYCLKKKSLNLLMDNLTESCVGKKPIFKRQTYRERHSKMDKLAQNGQPTITISQFIRFSRFTILHCLLKICVIFDMG